MGKAPLYTTPTNTSEYTINDDLKYLLYVFVINNKNKFFVTPQINLDSYKAIYIYVCMYNCTYIYK